MSERTTNTSRTTQTSRERQTSRTADASRSAQPSHVARSSHRAKPSTSERASHAEQVPTSRAAQPSRFLQTSNLQIRIISGAVYVGVVCGCLWAGKIATAVLVSIMAGLCCIEFFQMMRKTGRMPYTALGIIGSAVFCLTTLLSVKYTTLVVFVFFLLLGLWYVLTPRANILDVSVTVFALLYIGIPFSSVVLIRMVDPSFKGALLTLGVLGSVWANDSLAYLVGSAFGKHKMAPKISPKKSWEGFLGGMVGSVVVWLLLAGFNICGITWNMAFIASVVTGLSVAIGDLFESRIKRGVGVKDSGDLIPGHGGMLDRSDSVLFTVVAARALLHFWGIL